MCIRDSLHAVCMYFIYSLFSFFNWLSQRFVIACFSNNPPPLSPFLGHFSPASYSKFLHIFFYVVAPSLPRSSFHSFLRSHLHLYICNSAHSVHLPLSSCWTRRSRRRRSRRKRNKSI